MKNGLKMLRRTSSSMPAPQSSTSMQSLPSAMRDRISTRFPAVEAWSALRIRLDSAWVMRFLSMGYSAGSSARTVRTSMPG